MKKIISPSMMCANMGHLQKEVEDLEAAGVDIFHVDFMDGVFVPNFGMGLQDFDVIRAATTKLVDVHLMIQSPGDYVEMFADKGADIIYFHPETDMHAARTIDKIKAKGKKAGIAINPGTAISTVLPLLKIVDYVMVMTVNPGFAGQKYLSFVDEKFEVLQQLKQEYGFSVFVDGAVSPQVIEKLTVKGVDGFVLGTSTLFGKAKSYKEIIRELKEEKK